MSLEKNKFSFAVYNNTGLTIDFDMENTSVNGWGFDTFIQVYDEEVFDGCVKVCTVKIDSDFREANQIKKIKNIEFGLEIRPGASYSDEYNIGPMTATFK